MAESTYSLDDSLSHRAPDGHQLVRITDIRRGAKQFAKFIDAHVPGGREKELATVKLEECLMWAIKGIIFDTTETNDEEKDTSND